VCSIPVDDDDQTTDDDLDWDDDAPSPAAVRSASPPKMGPAKGGPNGVGPGAAPKKVCRYWQIFRPIAYLKLTVSVNW